MDLQGRVVLVTGAGRGLGRSIALQAARAGATVVGGSRTTADLDSLDADVAARGGPATTVALSAGQSGWATREAHSIPEIAASSSLSDVSPDTPTHPTTVPVSSLTSTPPGTGTSLPPIAAAAELMK